MQNKPEIAEEKKEFSISDTDQLLELMQIYLSEWTYRDSILWKQVFTLFFAALVVIILPFAGAAWGVDFNNTLPMWVFPIVGLILTVVFLVIGRGYCLRLEAIGKSYNGLIEMLPESYKRRKLSEISSKENIFIKPLSNFLVYTMFVALLILDFVMFYITIWVI